VRCALILLVLASLLGVTAPAAAQEHRVRPGQTLAEIARRYNVAVSNLAGANGLRLTSSLRAGQTLRVPEDGAVYVMAGQTLVAISRIHGVGLDDLRRANRLGAQSRLMPGQRLVLPGHEASARAAGRYGKATSPGTATFIRLSTGERLRIRLVDARGRPSPNAARRLGRLLREPRSGTARTPPRRLIQLLARVSDHFGGRTIYVMSGYRPAGGYTAESSQHVRGHAVDIRVDDVANSELRSYCRSFERTGVGYYPNSSFVHLDVRDRSAYWVDYSRPGEAPRYRRQEGDTVDESAPEGTPTEGGEPTDVDQAPATVGAAGETPPAAPL
jgi:uncharacterized protein YcbK (DUF882 family)